MGISSIIRILLVIVTESNFLFHNSHTKISDTTLGDEFCCWISTEINGRLNGFETEGEKLWLGLS